MAIVCDICKKEVELIRFGDGVVGVCCDKVLYNSLDKSRFDTKPDEKKTFPCTRSSKKNVVIKQNIPHHERREL